MTPGISPHVSYTWPFRWVLKNAVWRKITSIHQSKDSSCIGISKLCTICRENFSDVSHSKKSAKQRIQLSICTLQRCNSCTLQRCNSCLTFGWWPWGRQWRCVLGGAPWVMPESSVHSGPFLFPPQEWSFNGYDVMPSCIVIKPNWPC